MAAAAPSLVRVLAILSLGAILVFVASLSVGQVDLSNASLRATVLELRFFRFAGAFLAGSALAIGGVLVQGLFRNPLASPSIIGTTAGASLGGRLALLFHQLVFVQLGVGVVAPEMLLPIGCVAGALFALLTLLMITRVRDDLIVLLLAGFLLSALFISLGSFLTSLAQERWELARAMISFALGDVSGVGPRQIALAVPLIVTGGIAGWFWARPLDVMLSGQDEAVSLGVDVAALRRWCVTWTALLTAGAVAIGGNVGFVGLVVPHALRPFVGVRHRRLLPSAALAGGVFLASCDLLTRVIPARTEIPLGVVTGLIGAPVFLVLLMRSRNEQVAV